MRRTISGPFLLMPSKNRDDNTTCKGQISTGRVDVTHNPASALLLFLHYSLTTSLLIFCHEPSFDLVSDSPFLEPPQMPPLLIVTLHTKHHRSEENEHSYYSDVKNTIDSPLEHLVLPR